MKTLVGEEDIAKHYMGGVDHYRAYRQFQALTPADFEKFWKRQLSQQVGASQWGVSQWSRGKIPASVKAVESLKGCGLLPLGTQSPMCGLVTYLAGLNWHSGMISLPKENVPQPAYSPHFSMHEPHHLDEIAKALNLQMKIYRECGQRKRYTLPAIVSILLSEMGVPQNGRKAGGDVAYPRFIDTLIEAGDVGRLRLFLGTQVLTRSVPLNGGYAVRMIGKSTIPGALRTCAQVYELYDRAFPELPVSHPRFAPNQRHGPYTMELLLADRDYHAMKQETDIRVREELRKVGSVQKPVTELQAS